MGEIIRGGEESRVCGREGNERAGGGEAERLSEEHEVVEKASDGGGGTASPLSSDTG